MSITIDYLQKGDEQEVIDLLTQVFGRWPAYEICCSKKRYWEWKYRDNPLNTEEIVVGKIDDEIVGCYHRMPIRVKIGLNTYLSSAGTDVAVHPSARGKRLFNIMQDRLFVDGQRKGVNLYWGVSSNPILVSKGKREKYGLFPYKPFKYFKIKDFNLHLRNDRPYTHIEKIGYLVMKNVIDVKKYFIRKKYTESAIKINEIKEYGSDFDNFWINIVDRYSFMFLKDKDYMNWRYCTSDVVEYKNFIALLNDEVVGYLVIKIEKGKYCRGYVVDLLTNNDFQCIYGLIDEAMKHFKHNNVNYMGWDMIEKSSYSKIADYYGFIKSLKDLFFHYNREYISIGDDEEIYQRSRADRLYFCSGDYDWI
jgi:hypothetical protein